jgi:cell pole-organizing protein PopZ
MSKPDPTGESLENILTSIRRSLSEQSTDALVEDGVDDKDAAPAEAQKNAKPRREGLAQRVAGTTVDTAQAGGASVSQDDLSDIVEEGPRAPATNAASPSPTAAEAPASPPPAATPAPGPAEPKTARSDSDPLWFLTRQPEPAAKDAEAEAPAQPASPGATAASAESLLLRPEVVRASLPPFFGSSAEAAKAEAAPVETVGPGVGVARPAAPDTATRVAETDPLKAARREVQAEGTRSPPGAGATEPGLRNGRVNSLLEPAAAAGGKAAPGGDMPHTQGLEVAVLELLRPMLRQWLDENMPRLVSAALAEEAVRGPAAGRDAKKP